nr:uncharacterized protein LOC123494570 [Aegilops tauschii subsp. strangulata]
MLHPPPPRLLASLGPFPPRRSTPRRRACSPPLSPFTPWRSTPRRRACSAPSPRGAHDSRLTHAHRGGAYRSRDGLAQEEKSMAPALAKAAAKVVTKPMEVVVFNFGDSNSGTGGVAAIRGLCIAPPEGRVPSSTTPPGSTLTATSSSTSYVSASPFPSPLLPPPIRQLRRN